MDGFCDRCITGSSDETAGEYHEGAFGKDFRGRKDVCPECGSHLATLWSLLLYFPATPIGTYRYKPVGAAGGDTQFLSRRVPLDEQQVRSTRIEGIIMALLIVGGAGTVLYLRHGG